MYAAKPVGTFQSFPDAMPSAPTPLDKPRIVAMLDQLEKLLAVCHDHVIGIENSADRITGPVPAEAGATAPAPPCTTIEQRLSMEIGRAEHLSYRLGNVVQRLNAAV